MMKISFDFEIGLPDIKQIAREAICRIKGHIWEKYKQPEDIFLSNWLMANAFFTNEERDKQCKRCYKLTYKKSNVKVRSVKFS